ncbi:nucleolar protein 6-like [Atheta coriaria]|uniref:nucleolar protein 6-like n=1 Tax=Dalotia coriaria TaxID=877792 RepID=UPI0031F34C84
MVEFKPEDYEFNQDSENSSEDSDSEPEIIHNKRPHDGDNDSKTIKKSKSELYKQPTAEEMNKLRETENLFNSNIFRLQINELLEEIKLKPKYQTQFDLWFTEFQKKLLNIPEFTEINLNNLQISKKKKLDEKQKFINYAASLDKVPCSQDVSMKFMKPKSIVLHGSLKNIPSEKAKFIANLMITMNKSMFFEKDYLNNKYALKKQFYMAYIENYIKNFDCIKQIKVANYLHNNHLPYLEVVPAECDQMLINIFIVPEIDTFKPIRFMPNKNNLKQLSYDDFPDFEIESFSEVGTFFYNSIMLFDCTLETNESFIKCLNSHENITDAIKLIVIWLRQRDLNSDYRCFTDDLVVYVLAYLFSKKKVNKLMSSYQVVRIFWSFIANLKDDEKLSIAVDVKPNNLLLFEGEFVLLDSTGCFNVGAFLDGNVYMKVKAEAKKAIESLDSNRFNSFSHLFTTKMPVGLQYDAILKIIDINQFKKIYWNSSNEEKFKFFGFYKSLIQNCIENQLKYGLTKRIHELVPIFTENPNVITYGLNVNPEHCYNVIEKGPRQYEEGAEKFKDFWGNLADLRRFKDSSIYEAVYFDDVKTIQDKRLIFAKIIEFVMRNKLELNYELNGVEMEKQLKLEHIENPFPTGSNEEAIIRIKGVQTSLDKILRNLQLPLPITACQCTSDLYSYTELFPPIPTNYNLKKTNCSERGDFVVINDKPNKLPHLFEPIECVLQLALNSKWPKTLEAMRAMKTIYYFEISKLLRLEHDVITSVRDDHIDLFYQGYVFRLRLHHPKEIALLKKDVTADGLTFYKDTDESLRLERNLEILPKISGALNGLHQANPSYGPSTCLIKRWMRSQMLDADHISDVVINLLNASLFITSAPYKPAILPQVAFLRFLKFMSTFDHNFQTVAVNFNDSLSIEELNEIDSKFLQDRQSYNPLHITTPFDEGKSLFTKCGPSAVVLRRIKCLAAESYKLLIDNLAEDCQLSYKACFVPNLTGYDVLIYLNASTNLRRYQQVNRDQNFVVKLEEFDESITKCMPVVGFDPIELYLKELRENFGEYALFFRDFYGGVVIGVLWKQTIQKQQDFKISTAHGRKLSAQNKLESDISEEDFYIYGKGIVRNIEVLRK